MQKAAVVVQRFSQFGPPAWRGRQTGMSGAVREFQGDDRAFLEWVSDHPDGYVVNSIRGLTVCAFEILRLCQRCAAAYARGGRPGERVRSTATPCGSRPADRRERHRGHCALRLAGSGSAQRGDQQRSRRIGGPSNSRIALAVAWPGHAQGTGASRFTLRLRGRRVGHDAGATRPGAG